MAIQRRFPVAHDVVFPNGAWLTGGVTEVADFDGEKGPDGKRPQQRDADSGLFVWEVQVVDADEKAMKRDKTVSVKILAQHQPVPPANKTPFPFTPVEFVGLTALPYIDDNGNRPRIAWSFRAEGLTAPGNAGKTTTPAGSAAGGGADGEGKAA